MATSFKCRLSAISVLGVHLCDFHHFSTSGFRVCTSQASFIVFYQSLAPDIMPLNRYVMFDVKRCSMTLFPVLPKPEVVFSGQTVAERTIYCIKVEKEVCHISTSGLGVGASQASFLSPFLGERYK